MSEHLDGVLEHKKQVAALMQKVSSELFERAVLHDYSKFTLEEFDAFERMTPILKTLTYGSEEYRAALREIKPAIQHHYQVNRHHPEYFEFEVEGVNGVDQMTLVDLIEMVCDWIAATQRVADGDIYKSLPINQARFHIGEQLMSILKNTVDHLVKE